jgi:hypothetical protein
MPLDKSFQMSAINWHKSDADIRVIGAIQVKLANNTSSPVILAKG